eukprot:Rmarinus@m.4025
MTRASARKAAQQQDGNGNTAGMQSTQEGDAGAAALLSLLGGKSDFESNEENAAKQLLELSNVSTAEEGELGPRTRRQKPRFTAASLGLIGRGSGSGKKTIPSVDVEVKTPKSEPATPTKTEPKENAQSPPKKRRRTSTVERVKSGEKRFGCPDCNYVTDYASALRCHKRAQHTHERPFQCSHCPYATVYASALSAHVRAKHTSLKPYECQQCEFASAYANSLHDHIRAHHSAERPFKCDVCDFRAAQSTHLRAHVRANHTGEKPYACHMCAFRSAYPNSLRDHIRARHSREKPFKCPECDFSSAYSVSLHYHLKSRHPKLKKGSASTKRTSRHRTCDNPGSHTPQKNASADFMGAGGVIGFGSSEGAVLGHSPAFVGPNGESIGPGGLIFATSTEHLPCALPASAALSPCLSSLSASVASFAAHASTGAVTHTLPSQAATGQWFTTAGGPMNFTPQVPGMLTPAPVSAPQSLLPGDLRDTHPAHQTQGPDSQAPSQTIGTSSDNGQLSTSDSLSTQMQSGVQSLHAEPETPGAEPVDRTGEKVKDACENSGDCGDRGDRHCSHDDPCASDQTVQERTQEKVSIASTSSNSNSDDDGACDEALSDRAT